MGSIKTTALPVPLEAITFRSTPLASLAARPGIISSVPHIQTTDAHNAMCITLASVPMVLVKLAVDRIPINASVVMPSSFSIRYPGNASMTALLATGMTRIKAFVIDATKQRRLYLMSKAATHARSLFLRIALRAQEQPISMITPV